MLRIPTETVGTKLLQHGAHGGHGDDRLDCAAARESYGLVWSRRVEPRNTKPAWRGGSHAGRGRGKFDLGGRIFPENPVSRQAESVAFGNGDVWPVIT